jgi:hypothetical protein
LKKWLKFEDKVNAKLVALLERILFLYQKYCPLKIQQFFSNAHKKYIESKANSINYIKLKAKSIIIYIPKLLKKLGDKLGNFHGYLTHFVLSVKSLQKKKFEYKVFLHAIQAAIVAFILKLKTWFLGLKKSTVIVSLTTTTVVTYSIFSIYFQGSTIFKSLERKPASIDTSSFIDVRPKYYKREDRFFNLYHIKLPLYDNKLKGHKNIKLVLTLLPSNKYIKEYFLKNEHIVKDKLSVMMYPIIPSLPVTEEGKKIIKEKVRLELNNLLKEKKIKGKVEEVFVNSVLGT